MPVSHEGPAGTNKGVPPPAASLVERERCPSPCVLPSQQREQPRAVGTRAAFELWGLVIRYLQALGEDAGSLVGLESSSRPARFSLGSGHGGSTLRAALTALPKTRWRCPVICPPQLRVYDSLLNYLVI